MKLNLLFLLSILAILTSCSGQNTSAVSDNSSTTVLGDTVSELSKSIWIVFQASNGDYWFGSDTDGAYRFDGQTIVQFTTNNGLSNNRVRGIQEDKHGNIFITTLDGIQKFDGHTFTRLTAIKSILPGDNWELQPDDLWFSLLGKNGEKGPYRYDGKYLYQLEFPKHYMADDYFKRFPNTAWSPYEVYKIYKDSKGTMWFGTSNFGLCRYDGKTLSWLFEDHLTNTPMGGSFGIRSILEDSKGKYWICNTRYRYDISPETIQEDGKVLIKYKTETGIAGIKTADGSDHIYFMSIVEDSEGDLWMATYDQGVWRYDGENVTQYAVKDGDKDVTLFSIYKDRQGGLWLGTHEFGVYKFNGAGFEKFVR